MPDIQTVFIITGYEQRGQKNITIKNEDTWEVNKTVPPHISSHNNVIARMNVTI